MPKASAASVDICALRLANQHLAKQSIRSATEIVSLLGAVQAQDYAGAKWGVAQRTTGASDAEIEKEISDSRILRTHVLRPTWHFVAAEDIRWMLAITAPRIRALMAHYDRKLGIDADVRRQTREVLTKSLRDKRQLTRTELAQNLTNAGVHADGTQRLAHLMMHAELDGLVCSGARRGKQFTYALLDECVASTRELQREEALHTLARRYFGTRGPATEDDFAWWSGLTKADAKLAVNSLESFESTKIDGRTYWFRPMRTPRRNAVVRLLPNYDEYVVSYTDRSATHKRVDPQQAGETFEFLGSYVITVDGQIVGRWKRSLEKTAVLVKLQPLTRLSSTERDAVEQEAKRFAKFIGLPLRIETANGKATARTL